MGKRISGGGEGAGDGNCGVAGVLAQSLYIYAWPAAWHCAGVEEPVGAASNSNEHDCVATEVCRYAVCPLIVNRLCNFVIGTPDVQYLLLPSVTARNWQIKRELCVGREGWQLLTIPRGPQHAIELLCQQQARIVAAEAPPKGESTSYTHTDLMTIYLSEIVGFLPAWGIPL